MFTPIFENTDSTNSKLDIQNLQLVEPTGEEYLYVINSEGAMGETYRWRNVAKRYPVAGWYKGTTLVVRSLELGEAFYIYAVEGEDGSVTQLQSAGSVKQEALTKKLFAGYNLVGNATPYTIDIQDIVIDIQDIVIENPTGQEYLYIINSEGGFDETYRWRNVAERYPVAGWYKGTKLVVREFLPGDGMYVYTNQDTSYEIKASEE